MDRAPAFERGAGTGKQLTGTARVRREREIVVDTLSITARCGAIGNGDAIVRTATTDASGAFVLEDVGPPPCSVQVTSAFKGYRLFETPGSGVTVHKLPASGVDINATAKPDGRGDE